MLDVDYYVRGYLNVSSTTSEIRYAKNTHVPCMLVMFSMVDNPDMQFNRQYTTILGVLSGTGRWENVRHRLLVCPPFIPPKIQLMAILATPW